VWTLRQELIGGLSETIVHHAHRGERSRRVARCPQCDWYLTARPMVSRTVETMVGPVQVERPYFSYLSGCGGVYPFDQALSLAPGRKQRDVQQAAAQVAIEMPYEEAYTLFRDLTGVELGSEHLHTFVHQAAEALSVLDVAPSRQGAFAVRCWCWVLRVLMCLPVPTVCGSAKRDNVTVEPDVPHGMASDAMPRVSDFISLMTSALSMC
jgi:hypothetical protein